MKLKSLRPLLVAAVVACSLIVAAEVSPKPQLALSTVSVTLSNPRPSFKGGLAAGNNVGSSLAFINTTAGAYPSTSAAEVVQGDGLAIGLGGTMGTSFSVASTSANNIIYLTTTLGATNIAANSDVISSQSTNMTVRFNTANAINGGRFRVLVPSDASNRSADGIPDVGLFDGGYSALATSSGATITCPTNTTGYNFTGNGTLNNGVATRSATTIAGVTYTSFECWYWGTGGIGTTLVATISGLINPAPLAGHTIGVADTPKVIVQHFNNQFQVIDQTTVSLGLIEAVKIYATVAPQITFKILGMSAGQTACEGATTTNVSTEPTMVPFGDLLIANFTLAAQTLTVSTNAANGYVVTAKESDQLGIGTTTCTGTGASNPSCLVDSPGDTATMTYLVPDRWINTNTKGFAFSVNNSNSIPGMSFPFTSGSTMGGCTGGSNYCYKRFADSEQSQPAQTIFSASTPVDNNNAQVCYKAVVSSTQASGEYQSYVVYTATATF